VQGAEQKVASKVNTAAVPPGNQPWPYANGDEDAQDEAAVVQGAEQKVASKVNAAPPGNPWYYVNGDEDAQAEEAEVQGAEQKVTSKAVPPGEPPGFSATKKAGAVPPGEPPGFASARKAARHAHAQEAEIVHGAQSGRSHLVFFSAAALVAVLALVGVIIILNKRTPSPSSAANTNSQVPFELV
jgi:hypothetical protein